MRRHGIDVELRGSGLEPDDSDLQVRRVDLKLRGMRAEVNGVDFISAGVAFEIIRFDFPVRRSGLGVSGFHFKLSRFDLEAGEST